MNHSEILDYLQLSFAPQVGPAAVIRLMKEFGEAGKVLNALPGRLQAVHNIGRKTAKAIARSDVIREQLTCELQYCMKNNIEIVCYHHENYPQILRQTPSPPPVVFCLGNIQALNSLSRKTLAVVGTRHPTLYGQRVTRRLTAKLSRHGFTIVSGLARGIDRIAHEATLDECGVTLAVLGSGLQNIYPTNHGKLAQRIQRDGLVISEVLPSSPPHSRLFPRRNRIISGLSYGTLIIEAALRSGALITARHALEQNREVLAIPGMIDTAVAGGCNKLIKDGAQLVESVEDIFDALNFDLSQDSLMPTCELTETSANTTQFRVRDLSVIEAKILQLIPEEPTFIDMLELPEDVTTGKLLSTLTTLELKQFISRPASNVVVRIETNPSV